MNESLLYIPSCLDLDVDLTWGWDVFYRTGLETTRTRCKPLTDKPCQVYARHTNKQIGLEKYIESPQPDLQSVLPLPFLMNFWEKRGSSVNQ